MKKLIVLILLALLVPVVSASVEIRADKSSIIVNSNQVAHFIIIVKNDFAFDERFELYVKDFLWNAWSEPLSDYLGGGFDLKPGESRAISLYLKPPMNKPIGSYGLPLIVSAQNSYQKETVLLTVDIVSGVLTTKDYAIGILSTMNFPAEIDPRENYTLDVFVENTFPRNITGMKVLVDSAVFKKETNLELGPLESAKISFIVKMDPRQEPLADRMKVSFYVNNELVKDIKQNFHVIGYFDITRTNDEFTRGFLSRQSNWTYYNDGNKKATQTILYPASFFKRIFLSSVPKYYVVSKTGGSYIAWDLELEPEASTTIIIRQNYLVLFILGFVIIVIGLCYYIFRSPLVMDKEIKLLEIKDGAISELKVLIHAKNRSGHKLTDIKIGDRVPGVVGVEKEFDIGTIQPTKMIADEKGATLLRWEIPEIEPYEERIISYKVKARLKVLGNFSLPPALAKFKSRSAELKARSRHGTIMQK